MTNKITQSLIDLIAMTNLITTIPDAETIVQAPSSKSKIEKIFRWFVCLLVWQKFKTSLNLRACKLSLDVVNTPFRINLNQI